MRNLVFIALVVVAVFGTSGCTKEKQKQDRSDATQMYERICKLTKEYTDRLEAAPDSADWAAVCSEFEDKLDKISFSYPPDTDLLLTEGQNDTIHNLMQEYVKIREDRIHGILHPVLELDSLSTNDSLALEETSMSTTAG